MGSRRSQVMKRWYQLSMLQMLTSTAVVAVVLAANLATKREPYYSNLDSITPAVIWKVEVTAGWPFTYLRRSERPLNVGADSDPALLEATCIFNENATERTNVTLMPLVGNISAALALLMLDTFLTGRIELNHARQPRRSPLTVHRAVEPIGQLALRQ